MHSRKFWFAVLMCVVLVCCALTMESDALRAAVLTLAALVTCVWIACEARVDRAAAPLYLPEVQPHEVNKPPEEEEDDEPYLTPDYYEGD